MLNVSKYLTCAYRIILLVKYMGSLTNNASKLSDNLELLVRDKRALSKLISLLEQDPDLVADVLNKLWVREPRAHVIGVTGAAGVGKSTLIAVLAKALSDRGYRVGVIAIDPSSPFSGGAILGDRIRMKSLTSANIFLRSMSTGAEESLPCKALLAIEVLEGVGYNYIIVETPGAGQYSVNIMKAVDTVLVTLMPGAGDEIQAIKAGLMEIGDIYVINKADRPEAEMTYNQVLFAVKDVERSGWKTEVVKVSALYRKGIEDLINVLLKRDEFIRDSGLQVSKRKERRKLELELLLDLRLKKLVREMFTINSELAGLYERAVSGDLDTVSASKVIMSKLAEALKHYKPPK